MGRTIAGGYAKARTEKQSGADSLCGQEVVGKQVGLDRCVISTQQAL